MRLLHLVFPFVCFGREGNEMMGRVHVSVPSGTVLLLS